MQNLTFTDFLKFHPIFLFILKILGILFSENSYFDKKKSLALLLKLPSFLQFVCDLKIDL
jgi:hypothetical protein